MGRLNSRELETLLDFMREIYIAHDLESLRRRLPAALASLIPVEMTTYFEIDRRRRRVVMVNHPDDALRPSEEQAFARYMHQSPLFGSYRRGAGSAVKISDFLTRAQFQRLALYDEFFGCVGVEHQIVKGLPGPSGLFTGIALHRRRRDFGEGDRWLLNLLRPHLNEAYGRARLMGEMREELNFLRAGLEKIDRGLIVADATGRVRLTTPSARRSVEDYFDGMRNGGLPDALRRFMAHEEALLSDPAMLSSPRAPLVAEREGRRLDVRIVFDGDQRLLLLDEHRTTPCAQDLEPLGLSRRQAEVLAWIAEGKTNAEIATILGMSERTVEKHVEHILRRLDVETRTAAAARALAFIGGIREAPRMDGREPTSGLRRMAYAATASGTSTGAKR
jgi:DNA-binding CsgD family transcriptional regulator